MKRFLYVSIIVLAISFTVPEASAQTQYSIDSGMDDVEINTTVTLQCDEDSRNCPVNSWSLPNWYLPEDTVVENIRDTKGEIDDYTINGNTLSLETNEGEKRRTETVKIQFRIERPPEKVYRGLRKREFSLPGFTGKTTQGTVRTDNLISGRTSYGFETAYGDDRLNFTGSGPVNVRLKSGEGNETEYFEFFGKVPQEDRSLAYEVPVAMTGQVQNFRRFPVAVMDSKSFNESVGLWSAGEYVGGSIKIRDDLEEDFTPILAHEVVHGLNDRVLNWDQTSSSYIDEGTGKYVEYLLKRRAEGSDRVRELFGSEVTYIIERDGKRYRVRLPSQGDRERLWNYYRNDEDFLKEWSPMNFPEERTFGYAYSELIIRNYVANTNGSMKDVYLIDPGKKINSNEEKWSLYSKNLDLRPCDYPSRERFDQCLDKINDYEYELYRATNIERGENRIEVEDVPIKASPEKDGSKINSNQTNQIDDVGTGFYSWLNRLFQRIALFLSN